jgi:hypothetical protein
VSKVAATLKEAREHAEYRLLNAAKKFVPQEHLRLTEEQTAHVTETLRGLLRKYPFVQLIRWTENEELAWQFKERATKPYGGITLGHTNWVPSVKATIIGLNPFFSDPEAVAALEEAEVVEEPWIDGIDRLTYTVYHEFGHALAYTLTQLGGDWGRQAIGVAEEFLFAQAETISHYATTQPAEAFAEAFARVELRGDVFEPLNTFLTYLAEGGEEEDLVA